jgi:hypothetical protein
MLVMTRVFPDPYEHVRGTVHDPAREQDAPIPGVSSRADSDEQFGVVARENGDDSAVVAHRRGRTRNGRPRGA